MRARARERTPYNGEIKGSSGKARGRKYYIIKSDHDRPDEYTGRLALGVIHFGINVDVREIT